MAEKIEIKIVIEPTLAEYFEAGMNKRDIDSSVAEEMTEFLATILNDSIYPIVSKAQSKQEIHLSYRLKPFADPIF